MKSRVLEQAGKDAVIEAWNLCSLKSSVWALSVLTKDN